MRVRRRLVPANLIIRRHSRKVGLAAVGRIAPAADSGSTSFPSTGRCRMASRTRAGDPAPGSPLVGVIMGSRSDWDTMRHAVATLEALDVPHEVRVVSAHRTPDLLFEYAATAEERGIEVVIAGAGGAAHLPGMVAAKTVLPVLGVPVQSRALKGMDSLLSIAQMPGGRAGGDARHRGRRRDQRRAAGGAHPGDVASGDQGGRARPRTRPHRGGPRGSRPERAAAVVRVAGRGAWMRGGACGARSPR